MGSRAKAFALWLLQWVAFLSLCCVGVVAALLLFWGYVWFLQVTLPWGWASLLVPVVGAPLFLWLDARHAR